MSINKTLLKNTKFIMFSLLVQQHFRDLHLILSGSAAINKFCPEIVHNDFDFVAFIKQNPKGLKKYPRLPVQITISKKQFKLKKGQYLEGSKTGEELSSVTYESVDNPTMSFDIIFIEKNVDFVVIDELRVVEPHALLNIYEANKFFTMDVKMEAYQKKVAALESYIQEQSESLATAEYLEKCTLSCGTPEKRTLSFDSPEKRTLSFDSPVQSLCFETPPTQKGDKENANSDLSPQRCLSFD